MSEATKTNGNVLIKNARLGYPKLFEPAAIKGDPNAKPRYGCQLYVPKSDEKTKALLDKEIKRLADTYWDGKTPKSSLSFIKDGDGEDGDENTAGHWIVSANRSQSQGRPQVIDRDPKVRLDSQDGKPYAGCYVNALISVFKPKGWDRACASLEIVQFVKDGEPFGAGRPDAAAVMPDLEEDDFEA